MPDNKKPGGAPGPGQHRNREIVTVLVWLAVLVGAGFVLEHSAGLAPAREALSTEGGPAGTTGSNLGRILDQLGAEPDRATFPAFAPSELPPDLATWVAAHGPSQSLISLVVDQVDLDDPEQGLNSNPRERGRGWERIAYVSLFEAAEPVYSARVGLRRHGGASRTGDGKRASWRLYFRDEYGSDGPAAQVFAGIVEVPGRIVVRKEPPGAPNLMAFEIARHNGALVPALVPARLLLNGDDKGRYLISEHINPAGWGLSHFGHRDFSMFIYRGRQSTSERSLRAYGELADRVATAPAPLTMNEAGRRVDLDNLIRHMFTFLFCGTTDWAQGAAVRDDARAEARWAWVHWDFDQSFGRSGSHDWPRPALEPLLYGGRRDESNDVRARLMSRLIEEDPEFRTYFVELSTELLDGLTNDGFLNDLLDRHAHLVRRRHRVTLREYFANRPAVLRTELRELVGSGS